MAEPIDARATRSPFPFSERRERENGKNGHALTRSQNGSERVGTTERLSESLSKQGSLPPGRDSDDLRSSLRDELAERQASNAAAYRRRRDDRVELRSALARRRAYAKAAHHRNRLKENDHA